MPTVHAVPYVNHNHSITSLFVAPILTDELKPHLLQRTRTAATADSSSDLSPPYRGYHLKANKQKQNPLSHWPTSFSRLLLPFTPVPGFGPHNPLQEYVGAHTRPHTHPLLLFLVHRTGRWNFKGRLWSVTATLKTSSIQNSDFVTIDAKLFAVSKLGNLNPFRGS